MKTVLFEGVELVAALLEVVVVSLENVGQLLDIVVMLLGYAGIVVVLAEDPEASLVTPLLGSVTNWPSTSQRGGGLYSAGHHLSIYLMGNQSCSPKIPYLH